MEIYNHKLNKEGITLLELHNYLRYVINDENQDYRVKIETNNDYGDLIELYLVKDDVDNNVEKTLNLVGKI